MVQVALHVIYTLLTNDTIFRLIHYIYLFDYLLTSTNVCECVFVLLLLLLLLLQHMGVFT